MSAVEESTSAPQPAEDLGFGSVVARESRRRFLNRDGTFNVRREGLRFWESLSVYHYFLTIGWMKFLGYVVAGYIVVNAMFAAIYTLCGRGALTNASSFADTFFFSVHTLATIGYGNIAPATMAANVVVTIESLLGLLSFAAIAGFVFARFARPTALILFSRNAVIAPFRDGRAFMFRIVNQRSNQIENLQITVLLSRRKRDGVTGNEREFLALSLERESVVFFPLAWTIVHPIDDQSPLSDWTAEELMECDAEFLILLNGFDETFSQTVHARSSYKSSEIVWGAKFRNMFNPLDDDGVISVDIRKLDDFDLVSL